VLEGNERDAQAAPPQAEATAVGAGSQALLLGLQRTVGNRAVSRMLQRQSAPAFDEADVAALKANGKVFVLSSRSEQRAASTTRPS
jgi:hypothetical protein